MRQAYILKVQGIDQVGHVLTSPVDHLIRDDVLVASGSKPLLDEKNLGVVIRALGEDTASTSPWRDDVERHTET